ncbi:MAG: O-antigen ligase family protein [Elusimicrobiota bacterium]
MTQMLPTLPWMAAAACAIVAAGAFSIPAAQRFFPRALFVSGATLAVVGIIGRGQGNRFFYELRGLPPHPAAFGPFHNPNHAAAFLELCFFAGMGVFLADLFRSSTTPHIRRHELPDLWAKRILTLFLLTIIVWGIITTGSRGAQLTICIGLALWSISALRSDKGWSLRRAACAILLPLALFAIFRGLSSRSFPIADWRQDWSFSIRHSIYRSAVLMLEDDPLLGEGLGTFQDRFPAVKDLEIHARVDNAHGDWLMLAVEIGPPAALIMFCLFLGFAIHFLHGGAADIERSALSAAAISIFLHGLVESILWVPALTSTMALCLAWIASPREAHAPRSPLTSRLFRPAVLALCLIGISFSTRPLAAAIHTLQARSCPMPARPYHLQRAAAWMPTSSNFLHLAEGYLDIARVNPEAAQILMREALESIRIPTRIHSGDTHCLRLSGSLLHYIDRISDGRLLAQRARLLDYAGK